MQSLKQALDARFRDPAGTSGLRRYEILADELRRVIVSGELKVGDPLPAERDLVALTGLGRGSVREAIRILEIEGLLSPKGRGRKGLAVIQNASDQTVQRQIELYIGGDTVSNQDLMQARLVLEPALARIACDQRTECDIGRMRETNARIAEAGRADRAALVQLNHDWHSQLIRASHNDLLIAIAVGLSETQHQAGVMAVYGSDEHVRLMVEAHDRILESVVERDGDRAFRRMYRHLVGYSETIARLNPAQFDLSPLNPR